MDAMQSSRSTPLLTRLVAYIVLAYGISIIIEALFRQIQVHKIIRGHHLGLSAVDLLLIVVPQIAGLGFIYLGTLLMRRKYNAWLAAMALFGVSFVLDAWRTVMSPSTDDPTRFSRLVLPILIVMLLWMTRKSFRVRSDMRTFQQALWVSVLVLGMAFLYGLGGYAL